MKRGELWVVNLEPGFGRELHKKRPAVIMSNNAINQSMHSVIIIPASSQVPRVIGLEMVVLDKKEGLDKPSVLLPVFIRSIDKERLVKKIGVLNVETMQAIEESLKLILAISS